jgi:hypothetical protein
MGGGKSGSAGKTYDYYGTIACGISIGPIDDLVGIILDGQEVWPSGASAWPSSTAAFNITSGKMYVFDAQVWIAQKNFTVPANPLDTDPTIPGNDPSYWLEYTFPRPASFSPAGAAYNDFTITTSDATPYGTLRFYWGIAAQTVDNVLNGNNDAGDVHPNYAGICYCIPGPLTVPNGNSSGFLLGQEVQNAPNIEVVLRRAPTQSIVVGAATGIVDGQCNLATWLAEVLTNENGLGLSATALDAVSFNNVATYLQTNEALYGASPLIDTSDTLRSVLDQFTAMIDGYVRFNPATKLIELGVYQHGQTPGVYTTLTEDSLTERPQLKSTSWQQTYSRATIRYNDRQLNFQQTSVHADDPRAWAVLKTVREISLDRPWITRAAQALLHGRETLRVVGHAQITGTLTVRREIGRNIRGGDYVLLDVDIEPNVQSIYQFFRVTKKTMPQTGPVKLTVEADNTLPAIPWNGQGAPVISPTAIVPPVVNFRLAEIPTVLAGVSGAVTALVQRPGNLITSCQVFFDTDPAGTFASLGVFSGFAALGTLAAAVTASASTLLVNVDTTQPDADFFTQQFSANAATDDTMLAFLVQSVSDAGQADNGQIAETSGYALLEVCSISVTTLVAAGQYQLNVLRGRQNTAARAFSLANSEVWLIPRANVNAFTNALFATLRANRAAGVTPFYGQFRFCPATFTAQYALANAANEPFRFALNSNSAPTLSLTAPASYSLTIAATKYPLTIPLAGTWSDPDGNLVELKVLLRRATESSDRPISDTTFAPTASKSFKTSVSVEQSGSWTIKLIARDATNFVTERDINVVVTGGGAAKSALPQLFDCNGEEIVDYSGVPQNISGVLTVQPNRFIPDGALSILCSTPGTTIKFTSTGVVLNSGVLSSGSGSQIYAVGSLVPFKMLTSTGHPTEYTEGGTVIESTFAITASVTILVNVYTGSVVTSSATFILRNAFNI